jgi:hypothetical protein
MVSMTESSKKHPCHDCYQCQWCRDERCGLCLKTHRHPRLSIREQIALYERLNSNDGGFKIDDETPESSS